MLGWAVQAGMEAELNGYSQWPPSSPDLSSVCKRHRQFAAPSRKVQRHLPCRQPPLPWKDVASTHLPPQEDVKERSIWLWENKRSQYLSLVKLLTSCLTSSKTRALHLPCSGWLRDKQKWLHCRDAEFEFSLSKPQQLVTPLMPTSCAKPHCSQLTVARPSPPTNSNSSPGPQTQAMQNYPMTAASMSWDPLGNQYHLLFALLSVAS